MRLFNSQHEYDSNQLDQIADYYHSQPLFDGGDNFDSDFVDANEDVERKTPKEKVIDSYMDDIPF